MTTRTADIDRHFRTRGELAVFELSRRAIEETVQGTWLTAYGDEPDPLPQLETAIATMVYVNANVSWSRYRLLEARDARLPDSSGEALEMGAGLCGHQAQVFASIGRSLGLDVHQVGFQFTTERGAETHAAVEVVVHGRWCFFDVTHCCYWQIDGLVLGIDEIDEVNDREACRVTNRPALALDPDVLALRDPFAYLDGERWLLNYEERVLA